MQQQEDREFTTRRFQYQCEVIEDLHRELRQAHRVMWVYRVVGLLGWIVATIVIYNGK